MRSDTTRPAITVQELERVLAKYDLTREQVARQWLAEQHLVALPVENFLYRVDEVTGEKIKPGQWVFVPDEEGGGE